MFHTKTPVNTFNCGAAVPDDLAHRMAYNLPAELTYDPRFKDNALRSILLDAKVLGSSMADLALAQLSVLTGREYSYNRRESGRWEILVKENDNVAS